MPADSIWNAVPPKARVLVATGLGILAVTVGYEIWANTGDRKIIRHQREHLTAKCPDIVWNETKAAELLAGCDGRDKRARVGQPDAGSPVASAAALPSCDAAALWSDTPSMAARTVDQILAAGNEERGTPEQEKAKFVTTARSWSVACRKQAMIKLCEPKCDDLVSSMLIEASASPEERTDATRYRYDRNAVAIRKGRALYASAKTIVDYAISIKGSPRAKAYQRANQTAEDIANDLVNGNPCIDRLHRDFARIDAFNAEVESSLAETADGCQPLLSVAPYAKSCVNCSDDRSECDDMKAMLKQVDDNLKEDEAGLAKDKVSLSGRASDATKAPSPLASTPHLKSPSLRQGPVQVDGRLSQEVIQGIVRQNFGRFRLCYENGLRTSPHLQGRVGVKFVIDISGSVSTASDGGSDLADAIFGADQGLVSCVVRGFGNLSFPQPEGGIVKVVYSIIFNPGA